MQFVYHFYHISRFFTSLLRDAHNLVSGIWFLTSDDCTRCCILYHMSLKREMAIAIIVGLLLGGTAAVMLTRFSSPADKQEEDVIAGSSETQESPTPTPLLNDSVTLDVLFPEHQSYLTQQAISVSGKTIGRALVIITTPIDEIAVHAGEDGTYSGQVELAEGANEIYVAVLHNDLFADKTLIVNYTQEEI